MLDSFVHFLLLLIGWIALLLPLCTGLKLTLVPPTPNPSSKLNTRFIEEVKLHAQAVDVLDGRLEVVWDTFQASLVPMGTRSVRVIANQAKIESNFDDPFHIISLVLEKFDMERSIHEVELVSGQNITDNRFHVKCRRYQTYRHTSLSTDRLCQELISQLCSQNDRFKSVKKSQPHSLGIHVLLFDDTVSLEITALVPPLAAEELSHPGMKRVESWALARTLNIEPGDIVVDPMCGKGSFLVEAASFWPARGYFGFDISDDQLQRANVNTCAMKLTEAISLERGDSRELPFVDDMVDKIIVCPPFNNQFHLTDGVSFYELLREWGRVLKSHTGRMAILIDESNVEEVVEATYAAGCRVTQLRRPFKLGRLMVTIAVAMKGSSVESVPARSFLEWESVELGKARDRALWSLMRSQMLPSLVPYSELHSREP